MTKWNSKNVKYFILRSATLVQSFFFIFLFLHSFYCITFIRVSIWFLFLFREMHGDTELNLHFNMSTCTFQCRIDGKFQWNILSNGGKMFKLQCSPDSVSLFCYLFIVFLLLLFYDREHIIIVVYIVSSTCFLLNIISSIKIKCTTV